MLAKSAQIKFHYFSWKRSTFWKNNNYFSQFSQAGHNKKNQKQQDKTDDSKVSNVTMGEASLTHQ